MNIRNTFSAATAPLLVGALTVIAPQQADAAIIVYGKGEIAAATGVFAPSYSVGQPAGFSLSGIDSGITDLQASPNSGLYLNALNSLVLDVDGNGLLTTDAGDLFTRDNIGGFSGTEDEIRYGSMRLGNGSYAVNGLTDLSFFTFRAMGPDDTFAGDVLANLPSIYDMIAQGEIRAYGTDGVTEIGRLTFDFDRMSNRPFEQAVVPEPGTWAAGVLLLGGAGLHFLRRKMNNDGGAKPADHSPVPPSPGA